MNIKNILFCLIVMATLHACTSKNATFEIAGTVDYEQVDSVILKNYKGETLAMAPVNEGEFLLAGSVEEPTKAAIYFSKTYASLILENDKYEADFSFESVRVKGGDLNDLVYSYKAIPNYLKANKEKVAANMEYALQFKQNDVEATAKAKKILKEKSKVLRKIVDTYQGNILEGDYSALAKLFVLSDCYNWDDYGTDKKLELYNLYEKELGEHAYLNYIRSGTLRAKKRTEKLKSVDVGKPYKDIICKTAQDETLKLSDVIARNEYTLIEFWASWCSPCRGSIPHLKSVYEKFHAKGFEIYGVSIDTKMKRWLKALKEENLPWPNVIEPEGRKGPAAQSYAVNGIPATFLISKDGVIVATRKDLNGFDLDRKLEELLNK